MTISPEFPSALGIIIVFFTTATTVAVTWGVFRAQLERLIEEQRELRSEVKKALALVTDISVITQRLVVVETEVSALRTLAAGQSNEIIRLQAELRRSTRPHEAQP